MKKIAALFLLVGLSGCGSFGQGLRDGFAESLPGAVAGVVADRLEKRDGTLAEAIRKLPDSMPKPIPPQDNTIAYGIAFLLAKLTGDGVRSLAGRALGGRKDA